MITMRYIDSGICFLLHIGVYSQSDLSVASPRETGFVHCKVDLDRQWTTIKSAKYARLWMVNAPPRLRCTHVDGEEP